MMSQNLISLRTMRQITYSGNTVSVDMIIHAWERESFAARQTHDPNTIADERHPTILCESLMRPILVNTTKTKLTIYNSDTS